MEHGRAWTKLAKVIWYQVKSLFYSPGGSNLQLHVLPGDETPQMSLFSRSQKLHVT